MIRNKKIKNFFSFSGDLFKFLEFVLDLSMVLLGFYLASFIRDAIAAVDNNPIQAFLEILGVLEKRLILPDGPFTKNGILVTIYGNSLVYIILLIIFTNIYDATLYKKNFRNTMLSYAILLIIMNGLLMVGTVIFKFGTVVPSAYFTAIFIQFSCLFFVKFFYWKMIKRSLNKSTLIVTGEDGYKEITLKVVEDKDIRDRVKCIYLVEDDQITDELLELVNKHDVVHISSELSSNFKNKLIAYTIGKVHKSVKLVPKIYELSINKSEYKNIDDKLTFNIKPLKSSLEQRVIKRVFDIVFSFVGIIISIPFLILGYLLIKIDDGGPFIYTQQRVGKNNKMFKIYKVRSMTVSKSEDDNTKAAVKNDKRITRVGKFIRLTRIDEMPQLWNILRGHMSFVGPRPLVKKEVDDFIGINSNFSHRSNVKPGLAGYAQYKGTYVTEFNDKLRMDLFYIRNQTFLFDMKIILATILTILNKEAAVGSFEKLSFEERLSNKGLKVTSRNKNVIDIYNII